MFDYVDVALDEFAAIWTNAARFKRPADARILGRWIKDEAVKAIDELVERREFRRHACWSVERLTAGARTDERLLVDRVADALVTHAETLIEWAQQRMTAEPPEDSADAAQVLFGPIEITRRMVEFVATRPWRDLASELDFLAPTAGLYLTQPTRIRAIEFVPMFDPALQRPGDQVAAMTLRRVRYWKQWLDQFHSRCHRMLAREPDHTQASAAVSRTCDELAASLRELESVLVHAPAARRRDDCASLVQAYAAYDPPAYRRWAGPRLSAAPAPTLRLWLENHDNAPIATRIAVALRRTAAMIRQPPSAEDTISEALRSHMLVVIGGTMRTLYWNQQQVGAQWHPASWETLWALATAAKRDGVVNGDSFGRDGHGRSPLTRHGLASRINRLKDALKRSNLSGRIDAKTNPGCYRLEVPANEIFVAEVQPDGTVVEATSRSRLRPCYALVSRWPVEPA